MAPIDLKSLSYMSKFESAATAAAAEAAATAHAMFVCDRAHYAHSDGIRDRVVPWSF